MESGISNVYETITYSDGTAVREYVHVVDVAKAHALAINLYNRFKKYNLELVKGLGIGDNANF